MQSKYCNLTLRRIENIQDETSLGRYVFKDC